MLDALQNAFKITKINYGLIITVRRSDQACKDAATIISAIKNLEILEQNLIKNGTRRSRWIN